MEAVEKVFSFNEQPTCAFDISFGGENLPQPSIVLEDYANQFAHDLKVQFESIEACVVRAVVSIND